MEATAIPNGSDRGEFEALIAYKQLQATWRLLRDDLRNAPSRDCIDFLDIDMDQERWLQRTRRRVITDTYRPRQPERKEAAKSGGHFRVITMPMVDDLLVYRHIAEIVLSRARKDESPGTYFSRRYQREPVGKKLDAIPGDQYQSFIEIWLRYNNYRKFIGLSSIYSHLVTTDIASFFDSVEHSLLLEYL